LIARIRRFLFADEGVQAKKNAAEAAFKLGDPSMKSHFSQEEA
jgi:hypothetical protein